MWGNTIVFMWRGEINILNHHANNGHTSVRGNSEIFSVGGEGNHRSCGGLNVEDITELEDYCWFGVFQQSHIPTGYS